MDGKLRAIQTASCLLQGPSEAGNRTLELTGIMESILALCASEREIDQQVAVEALIHAAGKAKRATFITANGVTLLKDIYKKNENDAIRIRALVVCRCSMCDRVTNTFNNLSFYILDVYSSNLYLYYCAGFV